MNVGPDVLRRVIVDHTFDSVDIDASGSCVCADQPAWRTDQVNAAEQSYKLQHKQSNTRETETSDSGKAAVVSVLLCGY